jgi:riboflavin biosynthesis pyrimidine reductase
MNIGSVLVEGGCEVFTQFRHEGLVDQLSVFVSPVVFGGGVPAFTKHVGPSFNANRLTRGKLSVRAIGRDSLLQYNFN